jgi:hypothetical protein
MLNSPVNHEVNQLPMRNFLNLIVLLCVGISVATAQSVPRLDDGSVLDVMVIYTPAGRAQMGGTQADVYARVTAAVDNTNQALATAGVATELQLVHLREIFYLEQINGDPDQDLINLITSGDGWLDDAHVFRDFYAADLVILIAGAQFALYTDNSPILSPADDTQAFGIVEGRYLLPINPADHYANFRRVVGHLLGVAGATPIEAINAAAMTSALADTAGYRDSDTRLTPSVELLNNGGFELDADSDAVPDFWARMPGSGAEDKLVCNPAKVHGGSCAVKVIGKPGQSAGFRQVINDPAALLGDELVLTAWGASTPAMTTGAGIKMVVKFGSLPKLKLTAAVAPDTSDYGLSPLTTQMTVNDSITKIKIIGKFSGSMASGSVWFDDFSLMHSSAVFGR